MNVVILHDILFRGHMRKYIILFVVRIYQNDFLFLLGKSIPKT